MTFKFSSPELTRMISEGREINESSAYPLQAYALRLAQQLHLAYPVSEGTYITEGTFLVMVHAGNDRVDRLGVAFNVAYNCPRPIDKKVKVTVNSSLFNNDSLEDSLKEILILASNRPLPTVV